MQRVPRALALPTVFAVVPRDPKWVASSSGAAVSVEKMKRWLSPLELPIADLAGSATVKPRRPDNRYQRPDFSKYTENPAF